MDPPPHKRPRMGLLPQTQPQLGLNNLEDWRSIQRVLNLGAPTFRSQSPVFHQPKIKQQIPEVSSTTSNSWPDTSDSPAVPVKDLSLPVDTAKEKGLTITISKAAHNCLRVAEGAYFRQLITQHLGVVVLFINPNAGHFVSCKLDGRPENLESAKAAVQNFCEIAVLTKHELKQRTGFVTSFTDLEVVAKNLNVINDSNVCWFYKAHNQYDRILELVDGIKDCNTDDQFRQSEAEIMSRYRKLNTIIISQLQNGKDKRHMEILQKCAEFERGEVETSFNYVFNSNRRIFPDYDDVLTQLMHKQSSVVNDFHEKLQLEQLKRKCLSMCQMCGWNVDRVNVVDQYSKIIINNYQNDDIRSFQGTFQELHKRYVDLRKRGKVLCKSKPSKKTRRRNRKRKTEQ
ncbi:hypothetical protein PPYR_14566 [Photinus pyralis]|uniref:Uncharacterized protein n=1 Tax=Photinus pyralis TaxID=7054 RepID=A0A5N4A5M1_PHOPY|nr:uncharacterized protein LOC116180546 isoform X1 [Photinus pyralis]KAB0792607.1 hypothetical protein PPYR_14566 [Photinus pyralis]